MSYHNFETYDAQLTGRCAHRRKIANNTWLERRTLPAGIAIRLHQTDVVTYLPNGDIVLDTGGWLTVTTKQRINAYSPFRVGSIKGRWMVYLGTGWDRPVPFADGITMHADGTITGYPAPIDVKAQDRANAKTKRDIKKFVGSITPERIKSAWENPGGDCFLCRFDTPTDSCLVDHVRQDYFHAHLALRAVKASGYHNPDVIMSTIYYDAVNRNEVSDMLTRALTKLLRKNLIEGVAVK